jgi:RimJ/RimL family protein N-acetyltransferase
MLMPTLETERLVIRELVLDDLDAYMDISNLAFDLDGSRERYRESLEWATRNYRALANLHQPPYGDRAIVLRETNEMIGMIGLVPSLMPFGMLPSFANEIAPSRAQLSSPEFGLFWALHPKHWRKGFATEAARAMIDFAFDQMQIRRIVATTEYDNKRSQAVMRRLGMSLEHNPKSEPAYFQVVGILEHV